MSDNAAFHAFSVLWCAEIVTSSIIPNLSVAYKLPCKVKLQCCSFFCCILGFEKMSKISRDTLHECISEVLKYSQEKKRKFRETVELQVALKNYDPQKDKRFSGSVRY